MSVSQPVDNHIFSGRLLSVYLAIAFIFGFYMFRLFDYQIINGADYQAQADENRRTTIRTQTTRGMIYDRNGYILARNVPSYNVVITPAELPEDDYYTEEDDGAVQTIYRELAELIGMTAIGATPDELIVKNFTPCRDETLTISQIVYIGATNWPYDPIKIKCDVDEETAKKVLEKRADWPGVDIEVEPIREYPTGALTAEIVGFLGPIPEGSENDYPSFEPGRDKVGYSGIEQQLQDVLGGQNGLREVEVYASGEEASELTFPIEPVPGNNVVLTIDTRLQAVAKSALEQEIEYLHNLYPKIEESIGVVIAMDPKTGQILSLVSTPTYENNRMAEEIPADYYEQLLSDPGNPLFNYAISAKLTPGSVFKLAASIGILNEGVVDPDFTVNDPGTIELEQKYLENDTSNTTMTYYCWAYKTGGHGEVDFLTGLAQSCDTYFYEVGGGYEDVVPDGGLGIERLNQYARALGYGRTSGIELPGEISGLIPTPDYKRLVIGENWATGDTYISTIGQGYVETTALQVLISAATLANDGKMMKPTLIKEIQDSEGNVIQPFEPVMLCDITEKCDYPVLDDYTDPVLDENGNILTENRYAIQVLDDNGDPTGESKPVADWVIQMVKEGMRKVVTDGTAETIFDGMTIQTAGKTGTGEYCDDRARDQKICDRGTWPAHAWYVGYAPYDNPEIVVLAFVYHGEEGSLIAAPIVRKVMEAYFELKEIDQATTGQ